MFCPNCGNQIPDGYPFCSYCGAQFDNSYVNQQPQYQQPQYQQPQYQQPQYAPQQEYWPAPQQPAPRKSMNLVGVVATAAAVLIVGGIAAGIFLGRSSGSGPNKNPEKPDSGAQVQEQDEGEEEQEDTFSGWVVSVKREYDKEGNLRKTSEYSYDLLGRLVKEQRYNKEGTATQYDKYSYDLTGGYTVTTYINRDDRVYIVEQFDANGDKLLRIVYNEDGSVGLRHECIFDEQGRLIAKDSIESNGEFVGRAEYGYDEQDNQILAVFYEAGVEQGRTVMAYDDRGNLIREERIPNTEIDPYAEVEIYEYTYDDRNNLVKMQFIYRGAPYNHEEYFYDKENRLLFFARYIDHSSDWVEMSRFEAYQYNEQGLLISEGHGSSGAVYEEGQQDYPFSERTTYEYNAQGQVTVESLYYYKKLNSQKTTEYNSQGQPTRISHTNSEGLLLGETIFTYDGSGNLLSRCYTDENNEVGDTDPSFTMYEYSYDIHGNMTSEKYFYNRETTQYNYEYEYTFIP